jgi:hypothetical protein
VAVGPVTSVADFRPQPAVAASPPSVPTDLPAPQAVNPGSNIPAARNDSRKPDRTSPGTSNVVVIDPQTNAVVFRSVEPNSGIVIDQIPAQALLRQRAYMDAQAAQALVEGKDPSAAALSAEQQVDTTT